MRIFVFLIKAAILVTLSACAAKPPGSKPVPLASQKMEQRWKRPDMSRRSIYDPNMKASFSKKKDSGGWFGKQSYNANQYAGANQFASGKGEYVAHEFASGKSADYLKRQTFAPGSKEASMADDQFVTPKNNFGDQKSGLEKQAFSGGKNEYNTGAYYPAQRSQEFNRQPVILPKLQNEKNPSYTEEQVRHLMGRD